ncbi:hypothetical protein MBLNU13_g07694t1 [Cladosporium sp. NU13]
MPTYAILGATGQTGSSILDNLLQSSYKSPENKIKINAFVRSKQKLLSMRPAVASHPNISIYEGPLTDIALLASCIRNTRAQSRAVLAALEKNENDLSHANTTSTPPKLIVLSSASLEPHFIADLPTPFLAVMHTAASWMYADLRLAETHLRTHAPSNVELIFIKPGGLVHDAPVGHRISTTRQQTFLSFADLGAGMVEAADSPAGTWAEAKGNVSVVPAGEGTRIECEPLRRNFECGQGTD